MKGRKITNIEQVEKHIMLGTVKMFLEIMGYRRWHLLRNKI